MSRVLIEKKQIHDFLKTRFSETDISVIDFYDIFNRPIGFVFMIRSRNDKLRVEELLINGNGEKEWNYTLYRHNGAQHYEFDCDSFIKLYEMYLNHSNTQKLY